MCLPPQSKWTIDGLLSVVTCVKETVDTKPNPESCLLKHKMMCETFHLAPFTALHAHRPPQHFKGCAPAHAHLSPSEYYRSEFYKVRNVLYTQFRERFELRGMQMIKIWNLGCKSYNQALITLPENTPSTN